MIHPSTELRFISKEIGYGVVATDFIPAGTITWVLDELDREFTQAQFDALDEIYQEILDTYTFRNNRGNLVLCWDNGRYVNHSFHSNCLTTAYDFEIAVRDIQPGEQITDDYGYLNITHPFRAAEEGSRRKVVYPNDLLKYSRVWDRKLAKAFRHIPSRPQALRTLITDETWDKVLKIVRKEQQMESIINCYYDPAQH